jgi:hypothetical protein
VEAIKETEKEVAPYCSLKAEEEASRVKAKTKERAKESLERAKVIVKAKDRRERTRVA